MAYRSLREFMSKLEAAGELALVDGGPRTATVEATEDAQLLRLPRDAFLAVLAARPELGLGLLQALARWLRGARPT